MSGTSTPKRFLDPEDPPFLRGLPQKKPKPLSPASSSGYSSYATPPFFTECARSGSDGDGWISQRHVSLGEAPSLEPPSVGHDSIRSGGPDPGGDAYGAEELGQADDVCFGMLCEIQTQICAVHEHNELVFQRTSTATDNFVRLELVLLEDRGELHNQDGTTVAQLNRKSHLALQQLGIKHSVSYGALISLETLINGLAEASHYSGSKAPTTLRSIDVLVSGPRSAADAVAKALAKYHLFLQHPHLNTPTLPYYNPQYFDVPGASLSVGIVLPPILSELMGDTNPDSIKPRDGLSDIDADQLDPWQALNEFSVPVGLRQIDTDKKIKTALLGHQKEGVDFVIRRERQDLPQASLWELSTSESSKQALVYQHRITGARRPTPEDIQGGLLADDMGLGKTLTMIVSIVTTMSAASLYAEPGSFHQHRSGLPGLRPVKSTLVLVPSALLMDVWMAQVEQHVDPGALKLYKYHGPQRILDINAYMDYDVVISTYATVASDFSQGGGVLGRFKWYRLILDEAHIIRNWSTKQFTAVDSIPTNIRWCMTGTPIQNSVDDLGALVKFLRVPILRNKTEFRKYISGIRKVELGYARPNIGNLKTLLGSICLRRNKSILDLLPVTEFTYQPELSAAERIAYDGLLAACKTSINAAMSHSSGNNRSYQSVLEGLLRLRMFCNVGLEVKWGKEGTAISAPDQIISLLQQGGKTSCLKCGAEVITLEGADATDRSRLSHCFRLVCGDCAPSVLKQVNKRTDTKDACMLCGERCEGDIFLDSSSSITSRQPEPGLQNLEQNMVWPSKLQMVVQDISEHIQSDKSIVFSFWRQSLDVLGRLLHATGIAYCRVDGLLKTGQRKKVLGRFCSDDSERVLLMTLGTGATGLNDLSIASRVHFLEPQWNPSIESQAIGRVLRLGQEKQVCIVRYLVKGSIEKSVEERQITKIQLALAGGLHSNEGNSKAGRRGKDEQLLQLQKILELNRE